MGIWENRPAREGSFHEEEVKLGLSELSRACKVHAQYIMELVEEGIIEPVDTENARWLFRADSLKRVRKVVNLQQDLGVNLPGVALALELMEEMDELRGEIDRLTSRMH